MGVLVEQVWAELGWAERKVFNAAARALGHTPASLNDDPDAVAMLRKIAVRAGKALETDVVEQVGEALFDAAHENCDDETGCTGGGAVWYRKVAAQLVDPLGPYAAIAVAQQLTREDVNNVDGRETLDNTAWLGLLKAHVGSVRRAVAGYVAPGDDFEIRCRLIDVAALTVEWLNDLDKPSKTKHINQKG
jgi:hypothetical protein